jgi:signal peptidase I
MTDSLFGTTPQAVTPASPSQPRTLWKKPALALILSLFIDGLGQIYNGELIKGLSFALAGWVLVLLGFSYLMSSFPGLIFFIVLSLAYKIFLCANAFVVAKKLQVDQTRSKPPLAWRIGAAALIMAVDLSASSDYFIKKYLAFHAFKIPTASMCPTICEGDRVIADMRAFRRNVPQRGDVVIFLFQAESNLHIKRVAAVAGDEVSQMHGQLMINGKPLKALDSACGMPAVPTNGSGTPSNLAALRVPPEQLFLVGDNLDNSYDSRYYGTVEVSRVRGRPIYLYWSTQQVRIGCAIK